MTRSRPLRPTSPGDARRRLLLTVVAAVTCAFTPTASAHGTGIVTPDHWLSAWSWEPGVVVGLFSTAALYVAGLRALRWHTGASFASTAVRRSARWFWAGWVLLAVALVSPVHRLGQVLFSMHMTQHELLMVAAAPLLALGRPGVIWLSALPRAPRLGAGHLVRGVRRTRVGAWLMQPLTAWLGQALALWLWHIPRLFDATLDHDGLHALQHLCFLGSAFWFWHTVFFGPQRRAGHGMGVVYLFTTALHSGALGALITFATRPWYAPYAATAPLWGLSGIEDQQLGGLVMWIPAGVTYIIGGLALFASWMGHSGAHNAFRPALSKPLNPRPSCVHSSLPS